MTVRIHAQSRTYARIETAAMPVVSSRPDRLRRSRAMWRAVAMGLIVVEIIRWCI